jgi:hypothetical protein
MPSPQSPRPAAFAVVRTVGRPDLESATPHHQRSEGLVRGAPPKRARATHAHAADGADSRGLTLRSRSGPLCEGLKCLPRLLTWQLARSVRVLIWSLSRFAPRAFRMLGALIGVLEDGASLCAWIVAAHRGLFWEQLRAARHSVFSGRLSHGSLVPRRVLPSPKRFAATSARHECSRTLLPRTGKRNCR